MGSRHAVSTVDVRGRLPESFIHERPPGNGSPGFDLDRDGLTDWDEFAYRRKGPWPRPAPRYPRHMAPAVLDVPLDQRLLWYRDVGLRYARDYVTYWPEALRWARSARGYRAVSDSEFGAFFEDTVLARARTAALDRKDLDVVGRYLPRLGRPARELWKVDLAIMRGVVPFRGLHTSATITYLAECDDGLVPLAITIGDDVFEPRDGDAYELAKYFVLQGAAYHILLTSHPLSHFPSDTINAVATSALPKRHPLAKLLVSHSRYALRQNSAVLYSPRSIVENDQRLSYTVLTGPTAGIRTLNPSGYAGIEDNDAYPPYRFPLEPKQVPGRFGRFVRAYYDPVYELVAEVLAEVSPRDPHVARWADAIAAHLPGFPDAHAISEGDTLVRAAASYVYEVSIVHSTDHASFGKLPLDAVPLRLRQAPPRRGTPTVLDRERLATVEDRFRAEMARRMFFEPRPVELLLDVDYGFDSPSLCDALSRFRVRLDAVDAALDVPKVMRWYEFAAGIQY